MTDGNSVLMPGLALPIARYRFEWTVEEPITLSEYAGSAIRGAFGRSLRHTACMTHMKDCCACPLWGTCPYSSIFEPKPPENHPLQHFSKIPVPYVIEAPQWGRKSYEKGETLTFSIVLIGNAIQQLALIIFSLQRALGRNLSGGTASLKTVSFIPQNGEPEPVYAPSLERVKEHEAVLHLPSRSGESQRISFCTPLRLQENGRGLSPERINAVRFFLALSRRISLLLELHCGLSPNFPFAVIKEQAGYVVMEKSLNWQDWVRYSSRQEQRMHLGGAVGEITFRELSPTLLLLLYLGSWTHVGKNSSFGLGHYTICYRQ